MEKEILSLKKGLFICSTLILTNNISYGQSEKERNNPPNIILFLVDDMGWQDTSLPFWKEKTPFNEIYEKLFKNRTNTNRTLTIS